MGLFPDVGHVGLVAEIFDVGFIAPFLQVLLCPCARVMGVGGAAEPEFDVWGFCF